MPVRRGSHWIFWLAEWSDQEEKHLDIKQKSMAFESPDKAKTRSERSWGKPESVLATFASFIEINTFLATPPPFKTEVI